MFTWLTQASDTKKTAKRDLTRLLQAGDLGPESKEHPGTVQPPQINALLELLQTVLEGFADEPESPQALIPLLKETEKLFNADCSAIFARCGHDDYVLLASTAEQYQEQLIELVESLRKEFDVSEQNTVKVLDNPDNSGFRVTVMKLQCNDQDGDYLLIIKRRINKHLTDSEISLMRTVGDGFAGILGCAHKAQVNRRIALYEERAVIARELHDSLAQSLSYLKIQTSRLQKVLDKNNRNFDMDSVDAVLGELRTNINLAYAQLRELITTFRLTMNGRTLKQALKDSVEEFENKSSVAITLDNRLNHDELSVEEEMHVLQIVRESLSNIVRHAMASHAEIYIYSDESGNITLIVDDDGIGIDEKRQPEHHQGLRIMQQRARSLGGELTIKRSPNGGTRMKTVFSSRTKRKSDLEYADEKRQA